MKNIFTIESLSEFAQIYTKLVKLELQRLEINEEELTPDHYGAFVGSKEEFDSTSEQLLTFSTLIKEITLHNRRVRVFKLNNPLPGIYSIPKIEIFEPKPDADLKKERFGIEHIAFKVKDFDTFIKSIDPSILAKQGEVGNSKFAKTKTFNLVEIEFRNDSLGEEND